MSKQPANITATLVHGEVYALRTKHFYKGQPVMVAQDEMEKLQARAIDNLGIGNPDDGPVDRQVRQKFEFVLPAPAEAKTAAKA